MFKRKGGVIWTRSNCLSRWSLTLECARIANPLPQTIWTRSNCLGSEVKYLNAFKLFGAIRSTIWARSNCFGERAMMSTIWIHSNCELLPLKDIERVQFFGENALAILSVFKLFGRQCLYFELIQTVWRKGVVSWIHSNRSRWWGLQFERVQIANPVIVGSRLRRSRSGLKLSEVV